MVNNCFSQSGKSHKIRDPKKSHPKATSNFEPWSGLHIPESYLTALVQATCRKNQWALDRSTLYTQVTKFEKSTEITEKPMHGAYIYGLYLEGIYLMYTICSSLYVAKKAFWRVKGLWNVDRHRSDSRRWLCQIFLVSGSEIGINPSGGDPRLQHVHKTGSISAREEKLSPALVLKKCK